MSKSPLTAVAIPRSSITFFFPSQNRMKMASKLRKCGSYLNIYRFVAIYMKIYVSGLKKET